VSNPPADRSQLWTTTLHDTSEEARKAEAALSDAQKMQAGASTAAEADRAFIAKQADDARFAAQQQLGAAQHGAKLYQEQSFAVRTHNEPIEAALRAQEEARTRQIMEDTAKFAAGAAVATMAVGAAAGAGPAVDPYGPTSFFGMMPRGPATTMAMGPAALFGALAATPQKLGMEPALDKQLGPVMPAVAIDDVARRSPAVAADADAPANAAPAAEPAVTVAPVQRARNMAMELANNSLAFGPKPPTWATQKAPGSSGTEI